MRVFYFIFNKISFFKIHVNKNFNINKYNFTINFFYQIGLVIILITILFLDYVKCRHLVLNNCVELLSWHYPLHNWSMTLRLRDSGAYAFNFQHAYWLIVCVGKQSFEWLQSFPLTVLKTSFQEIMEQLPFSFYLCSNHLPFFRHVLCALSF